QLESQ
ncbi:hypothetical protein VCHENC02_1554B, partial [Vibrio harveyi]